MFETTAWWIYAYLTLDNFIGAGLAISLIATACVAILGAFWYDSCKTDEEAEVKAWIFKWVRVGLTTFIIFVSCDIFLPDKDDLKLIFGGSAIVATGAAVINADGAEEIPQNMVDAANAFLEGIETDAAKK